MKSFLAILLATSAAAQSTSVCAAENIVVACLAIENALLATCGTSDWACKCNAYGDIVTCYNNCPGDSARDAAVSQHDLFCSYASVYPSAKTTTTANGTAAIITTAGITTTAATKTTTTAKSSKISAATAFTATATGAASIRALDAPGLLAALVGAVAALA